MPIAIDEIIVAAIVDAIFGYIVDHGAGDWVRDKLRRDPAKLAYTRALKATFSQFEARHPQATGNLFDRSFFEKEAAPVLAQFLLRDGHPDPYDLAARWATSLNIAHGERRTTSTREMEPIAADFLDTLAQALHAESALADINDQRARQSTADAVAAIRTALNANRATPGTRRDYLHWLRERNLYLDARGTLQTQRQVQLKLSEIYISLRAQPEITSGTLDRDLQEKYEELKTARAAGTLDALDVEDRREHLDLRAQAPHAGAAPTAPAVPIDLSQAVADHEKLVILGDPGSGKTTLLRYLALMHAEALLYDRPDVGANLGLPRFPIFIRIADYAETGAWRNRALSDFLAENYTRLECPHAGLDDLITTELAAGNCLILLDGLDEIVNADERRGVVQQIENFVRRHDDKDNHFVVSSRIAGYRSASLGEPFAHFVIQDMDETEIRRFLNAWCRAVEDAGAPDLSPEARATTAQAEIDAILHAIQTSPGVRRLAANPLLLRTLALIHRTGAQLPQKRVALYKLAADTLARTWRIASGVAESALIKDDYLTPLLGLLAYWMHVNKPTGIATEREIHAVLGEAWADINDLDWDPDNPKPAIREEVRKFLLTVREHTGLFVERAPQRYGFMHLTFEEYYAARHLVARSRTRAKLIREHLHDPRWEEPILLALGYVGLDSPDESSELIELAILAQGEQAGTAPFLPSLHEPLLGRDYLFALRCLADQIPVRPRLMRRLIERLANEYVDQSSSARFQRYLRALDTRLEQLTGGDSASELKNLLITKLGDPDAAVRQNAADALGQMAPSSPDVAAALLAALGDPDAAVRQNAADALGRAAPSSPNVVPALLAALGAPDATVRQYAAIALGQMAPSSPDVAAALLAALGDPDAAVRQYAANALRQAAPSNPEAVPALLAALGAPDATVRQYAAIALGRTAPSNPEAVPALLAALGDPDAAMRQYAAVALGQMAPSSPDVVAALLAVLGDPDAAMRQYAAVALGPAAPSNPDVVAALLAALGDPEPLVRQRATLALEEAAPSNPDVVPALLAALGDPDAAVRQNAAIALRQAAPNSPDVVAALLAALGDPDAAVRQNAAIALRQAAPNSPNVVAALLAALGDPDAAMRQYAANALRPAAPSNPDVTAALLAALGDPNAAMRQYAAIALRQAALSSPDVAAALLGALRDPDAAVRRSVTTSFIQQHQCPPEILVILPEVLLSDQSWSIRRTAAQLLGQNGKGDDTTIQNLEHGLLDSDNDVRTACAEALVQLAHRFPPLKSIIEQKLLRAIDDPEFNKPDEVSARSGHDYAFHGLWSLVSDVTSSD